MKDPLNPELLAALAHDLRGPIGAIGTWVHVLSSPRADDETRARALAAMANDLRTMGVLVEDLSGLAEALRGGRPVSITPVDLAPFLSGLSAAVNAEGGSVTHVLGPEPPVVILADASGLRQALSLLLSRSVKRGAAGTRELSVALCEEMAEIGVVSLSPPSPLTLALARALVEAQAGELVRSGNEDKILIRIRLPLAP